MKQDINNYQFLLMQAVMEVWEKQMLQEKDWNTCWPLILTEKKTVKGMVNVRLVTGVGFSDEDVQKFKDLCTERFGQTSAPANGKVITHKENNIRYLLWKEARKNWPTPDFIFDCKWFYEKTGKQWPEGFLTLGHIIYDDDEYQPIDTNGTDWLCAIWDGAAIIFKGRGYVPVWWNSHDGMQYKPFKAIAKIDLHDEKGTVIKGGEKVRAIEGHNYCGYYDVRAEDGRIIPKVDFRKLEFQ